MGLEHVLVTGGGGFIGSHLARHLRGKGLFVRIVDLKFNGYTEDAYFDERMQLDLREWENCLKATEGIDNVYNLAANMGGIGFITEAGAEVIHDNILINANMLEAARHNDVARYFFSSSACVYPQYRQRDTDISSLREGDISPADPDTFYGWEKLVAEKMCEAYQRDYGLSVRIARYHNIYGPNGEYKGGREKSLAALCRKIADAPNPGTIEIWGDGRQTRSYCYIDDAVRATQMLMESDFTEPMNIGSDRSVTIDELADLIIRASGKKILKQYNLTAPQGVRGRNADISLARKVLGWEPIWSLEEGLKRTYEWISMKCAEDLHEVPLLTQRT